MATSAVGSGEGVRWLRGGQHRAAGMWGGRWGVVRRGDRAELGLAVATGSGQGMVWWPGSRSVGAVVAESWVPSCAGLVGSYCLLTQPTPEWDATAECVFIELQAVPVAVLPAGTGRWRWLHCGHVLAVAPVLAAVRSSQAINLAVCMLCLPRLSFGQQPGTVG